MNLRLVFANLRLVVWPLCMAYAAFLLAGPKSVSWLSVMITAAFLGAVIGFCLGIMFANRAVRRRRENVVGVNIARTFR
jgi:type III secretory pathway component EscT